MDVKQIEACLTLSQNMVIHVFTISSMAICGVKSISYR